MTPRRHALHRARTWTEIARAYLDRGELADAAFALHRAAEVWRLIQGGA